MYAATTLTSTGTDSDHGLMRKPNEFEERFTSVLVSEYGVPASAVLPELRPGDAPGRAWVETSFAIPGLGPIKILGKPFETSGANLRGIVAETYMMLRVSLEAMCVRLPWPLPTPASEEWEAIARG